MSVRLCALTGTAPVSILSAVLDSDGWGTEFGLVDGIHYAAVHGANV